MIRAAHLDQAPRRDLALSAELVRELQLLGLAICGNRTAPRGQRARNATLIRIQADSIMPWLDEACLGWAITVLGNVTGDSAGARILLSNAWADQALDQ